MGVRRDAATTKAYCAQGLLLLAAGCVPLESADDLIEPDRPDWASDMGRDELGRRFIAFEVDGLTTRLQQIPAGSFRMGSPPTEARRGADELLHNVEITQSFWMAETETTQALWQAVMGYNPATQQGDNLPIVRISRLEVDEYINKLNALVVGLDARLPSEAEWEYACRAGTEGPNYGDAGEAVAAIAWHRSPQTPDQTPINHDVGQKKPNAFGLHDMLGNVWEWCDDLYCDYVPSSTTAALLDPQCTLDAQQRTGRRLDQSLDEGQYEAVRRGGSVFQSALELRAAERDSLPIDQQREKVGFRIVRGPL